MSQVLHFQKRGVIEVTDFKSYDMTITDMHRSVTTGTLYPIHTADADATQLST